jgi:ribonuclease P protein component (EC 3.1.26.5)
LGYTRVGYSISKKVGKAVTRNRIRRLIKENLKDIPDLKDGYDIIFIGRIPSSESDYKEIGKSIRYLFRKSGVL